MAELRCEHFAACLGQSFLLIHAAGVLELQLERADPAPHAPACADGRHPFSLQFRGPRHPIVPQGTYRLENAELGVQEIFIVPIGADAQSVRYEAVFG